jgi:hypothetical protein
MLGEAGRGASRALAASSEVLREVRDWYHRTFGVMLDVRQDGSRAFLEARSSPDRLGPIDLGTRPDGMVTYILSPNHRLGFSMRPTYWPTPSATISSP